MMKNGLTVREAKEIIWKDGRDQSNILGILIDLQFASSGGYIDEETAGIVAKELNMTITRVYELISYYAILKPVPQAKHVLKICNSSPCHFTKSTEIAAMLKRVLGVAMGEATEDGEFAYHYIPCVGACDIGPVIKVKDTVFGNLDEEKVIQLIADLKTGKYQNL